MNELQIKHMDLEDYCKDGVVALVKEILSKEKRIDVCYDEGIYFYFALDLTDEGECLEILDSLLLYAEERKVNKKKLAETISDAMERVRGTIFDSACEKLKPSLEVLEEGSSIHYDSEAPLVEITSSLEESSKALQTGDIERLKQYFDKNSELYKLRIISLAAQNNKDEIIDAVVGMMDTDTQKAYTFRIAGDSYSQISLEKAMKYYQKSLELHPRCFITLSKLGALNEEFFDKTGDNALKDKAIEYYNAAVPLFTEHKVDDGHKLKIVKTHLKFLQENSPYKSSSSDTESLDDLLSFSSESYGSEPETLGDITTE